jgi:hypothetical protein
MIIHHDPREWEAVVEHRTCEYHKKNPGHRSYAGCTCSSSYGMRRRTKPVKPQPCPEPGCPIPQNEHEAYPPGPCTCPMHLYVPPGQHVHVDCPAHGKRVMRGSSAWV